VHRFIKNLVFGIVGTLPVLALVILGWGDWTTFFSNPARTGVIILALAGTIAYAFSGSSSLGMGRREDPSSRWIFVPLIIIAIVFAWLPPRLDRLDHWTIDGDTVRYTGLIITVIGGFIRVAAVFELGHRFSIFVAVQHDHRLKTDGFYRFVRHPSYLGALLAMAGWAAGLSQHHRSALNRGDLCAHHRADPCRRRISREGIRRTILVLSTTHAVALVAFYLLTFIA
jgi:protein-S-isoprenylcysteine O-methyltransferase Ste14